MRGIGPLSKPWEGLILPLYYTRGYLTSLLNYNNIKSNSKLYTFDRSVDSVYNQNMKAQAKKKLKLKAKNFSIILLEALKELGERMPQLFESKGEYQHRVWRRMRDYPTLKVQQGLYRLKQQNLIQPNPRKKFHYQLTLEGHHKLLIEKINKTRIQPKDQSATIIMFDIPEEKSKYRMFLRRLLLKNGFINLQKSVLISRYELPKEFFDLLNELKIRQYVTLIKGQVQYR